MFRISEFSKIARLSTRQLRHYDKIDLFKPAHIDSITGYRYYSATQLPQLNRILVLKDLGLELNQIKKMIDKNISSDEIHGMLILRKAQVEQSLNKEIERFRGIEDRIWQIETDGVLNDENVILKSVPERNILSTRQVVTTIQEGFTLLYAIHKQLPQHSGTSLLGQFNLIFHSDGFETEDIDVEMGFIVEHDMFDTFFLSDGRQLTLQTLPAIQSMATLARVGIFNDSVGHYGALGAWIEKHNYEVIGPNQEVFIEPFTQGKEDEAVVEIQIPVEKIDNNSFLYQ